MIGAYAKSATLGGASAPALRSARVQKLVRIALQRVSTVDPLLTPPWGSYLEVQFENDSRDGLGFDFVR